MKRLLILVLVSIILVPFVFISLSQRNQTEQQEAKSQQKEKAKPQKPVIYIAGISHGCCQKAIDALNMLLHKRDPDLNEKERAELQNLTKHIINEYNKYEKAEAEAIGQMIEEHGIQILSAELPPSQLPTLNEWIDGKKHRKLVEALKKNGYKDSDIIAKAIIYLYEPTDYYLSVTNLTPVCLEDQEEKDRCLSLQFRYFDNFSKFRGTQVACDVMCEFRKDFIDIDSIDFLIPTLEEIDRRVEVITYPGLKEIVRTISQQGRNFILCCKKRDTLLAPKLVPLAREGKPILHIVGAKHLLNLKREIEACGGTVIYRDLSD